jgi:hypothetical protein
MIGYLQTSFLPLRRFSSIEDLQRQHDTWARTVAFERRPRRLAGTVAEAWRVERGFLAALPTPRPSTDQHLEVRVTKDGFVRFGDVDYSVPPGLASRRVQLTASLRDVVVFLDRDELARHARSYVPADVVLDPTHVRALWLERAARRRLEAKDVAVQWRRRALYQPSIQRMISRRASVRVANRWRCTSSRLSVAKNASAGLLSRQIPVAPLRSGCPGPCGPWRRGRGVELFEQIRKVHEGEGVSVHGLARRFRVHRRTVRQALASAVPPARKKPPPRPGVLDQWKPLIVGWLEADRAAPRNQRHTARRCGSG